MTTATNRARALHLVGDTVVALRIGRLHFVWFGPLAGVAVGVGAWLLYAREIQALDLSAARFRLQLAMLAAGIVVGSRLYALAADAGTLLRDPRRALLKAGFAFQGGLLGVVASTLLFAEVIGAPWPRLFDALALATPPAHALGRLACLSYGCCHGREARGPLAITYENPSAKACWDAGLRGQPIHPTQLYSAASNAGFYLALTTLLSSVALPEGGCAALYLTCMGALRFIEESFRGEPAPRHRGITVYQWFCLAQIALGVAIGLRSAASPPTPLASAAFAPALARAAGEWPALALAALAVMAVFGLQGARLGTFSLDASAGGLVSAPVRWLDGPRVDVPFYMGAAVVGWATLLLHVLAGVPALHLYWVWILFLDGPHLWATLSRTYLDREERRTRRAALVGAFAWALPAAGTIAWGHATGRRMPFELFLVFAQLWAYWHVVRQHYGFLALYQRKGGEASGVENRADAWAFYVAMLAPFASFALRHPDARRNLGLGVALGLAERAAVTALGVITAAAIVGYALKELRRRARGEPVNVAKNLFLASCVPLHLAALLHPAWSTRMELLALPVIVTGYHNVQYNAIVWSFGRRRYGRDPRGETYGLAARLFRNPVAWYAAGVALTVALRYASWSVDGRFWPFTPRAATGGVFSATEYVNAWWWVVAMHHYYLDQKIWRVSRDADVRSGLGLAPAAR